MMKNIAVDGIIVVGDKLLVVKRNTKPFKGIYALPGGMVKDTELLKESVVREIKEETGLDVRPIAMLGVYDNPNRDPRHRVISIVYLCGLTKELNQKDLVFDKKEISDVKFVSIKDVIEDKFPLAFDHSKMVKSYYALASLGRNIKK